MFLSFKCNGNKPLIITIVSGPHLCHTWNSLTSQPKCIFKLIQFTSSSLSQQPQELDKKIMVSGQCEAEASNQSIACEAEAIPIELRYFSVNRNAIVSKQKTIQMGPIWRTHGKWKMFKATTNN